MTSVVFYFQVHQPYRLRRYKLFDVGERHDYFADGLNADVLRRVAERCYVPMNALLLEAIERTEGRFRCALSISGTDLRQMEEWAPEALDGFVALARTGAVELLGETAYHSLACQGDFDEWEAQVGAHAARVEELFGSRPVSFRNTELVFDNGIARRLEELGFRALLGEGADRLLAGKSPRRVYRPKGCRSMRLLLRDYALSDDVAFRFGDEGWPAHRPPADTFADRLHRAAPEDVFIGLFMDYETFGEHKGAETGILDLMKELPERVLRDPRFRFRTPAEVAADAQPEDEIDAPEPVSWADAERDLSAWLGNPMQRAAHETLYELGPRARRAAELGAPELLEAWRRLTTSDHVYYMSTKHLSDGDVHDYFSPHDTPHDAFITFMNVLDDLASRVDGVLAETSGDGGTPR